MKKPNDRILKAPMWDKFSSLKFFRLHSDNKKLLVTIDTSNSLTLANNNLVSYKDKNSDIHFKLILPHSWLFF